MSTPLSPRVQAALEQISEDESLISDVTDDTAAEVHRWLSEQVKTADVGDDDQFQQRVAQLRAAAQTAARRSNDEATAFVAQANIIAQANTIAQANIVRQRTARTYDLVAATGQQVAATANLAEASEEQVAVTTERAARAKKQAAATMVGDVAKAVAKPATTRTGPSRRERRRAKGKR